MNTIANNTLNLSQLMNFFSERVENTVEKGENADNEHFLLFQQAPLMPHDTCKCNGKGLNQTEVYLIFLSKEHTDYSNNR